MSDEFYIGYEPTMPPALAPRMWVTASALITCAVLLAGVFAAAQGSFSGGRFDYGREQSFEGRIVEHPYPALESTSGTGRAQWFWLVGPGKHGAADLVKGLDGRQVRVSGVLIERDGDNMIEVAPESVTTTSSQTSPISPFHTIGPVTVEGEIVDSKCHLGVMKPGEGPVHRDCAVRCLLGHIPPMLVFREGRHQRRVPLVATDGDAFSAELPSLTGRPVRVRGMLLERDAREFLATSARDIEVVGSGLGKRDELLERRQHPAVAVGISDD